MNNALLTLGGILITALAVLFAVPRFIDWNSYRGVFEEEASRILGREVRVGGAVNVRLLPAPYVAFEKLRIADAGDEAGGGGHSIIRVESFTMWLSVPPLLRGVLEANKVELRRPVLHLSVDNEGAGNWKSLAVAPGSLSFVPRDVALQSVKIDDGAVIFSTPQRGELARFDAIHGELAAEALEGPYKFKGEVNWGGTPRRVRLATAKLDANGDLRFKAAVDVTGSGNSYVLDGKLKDVRDKPALEGDITAKLVLTPGATAAPGATNAAFEPAADADIEAATLEPETSPATGAPAAPAAQPPAAQPAPPAPADAGPSGFELKAKVEGTTLGLALKDIAVSLQAGAAPQLITGEAQLDWSSKTRLDVTLASQWLDLDHLGRGGGSKVPLEAGRSYFEALAAALPAEADTNAVLEFDQLTLGGEPIANVRLAASRSGGPLELKGVRADLPGGVRVELEGILTPSADVPQLDGSLFASGKSLMRFLAWGLGNQDVLRERGDGPFSLDGHFALGNGTLALADATFQFAGTPLSGDLKLDLGENKKLNLSVEGPRIDVAQIGSGALSLRSLGSFLPGSGTAASDLTLDLKVAELVDGDIVLNDVDAVVRLEKGTLQIPRLKFSTPEGLSVEAEGRANDLPDKPKGAIRGLVSAPNAKAAATLLALVDDGSDPSLSLARFADLAPVTLAGTLSLGGGETNATALTVDGTLGGGRIRAALRLAGDRSQWRSAPLDLEAIVESPDVARLLATVFDARSRPATQGKSGRVIVKATGTPSAGLLSLADVEADGLKLGYRGQVVLPAPGDTRLDGELKVAASDARDVLVVAGLDAGAGAAQTQLNGAVQVKREAGVLTLDGSGLELGGSRLSGRVSLAAKDGGKQTITAKLQADKATFATLLAPVLAADTSAGGATPPPPVGGRPGARPPSGDAAAPTDATAILWPEQAFDFSALEKLDGSIEVAIGALALEPGLTLANARIAGQLATDAIKISRFEGDALGGRLTSEFEIAKAPAGVGLSGSLRIDISTTPQPAPAATPGEAAKTPPAPGDAAAFAVTFQSRALSPAAVISAMTGKGELTVGDATLKGNSPAAVSAVARAALTGQGPSGGNALAEAVREALAEGEVRLGKLTIPVEISDGALKLERVRIDMAEGRSAFVTVVELETMKIDSEWQIEPKLDAQLSASAARGYLPPVTVVYAGKLSQFADLVPTVTAGALERELVVRKMEIDVGELERLRKVDQERAKQDAERRRALEEDEAPAQAPAPTPPPPSPATRPGPDAVERENLGAPSGAATSVPSPGDGVPIEQDIEAVAPSGVAPPPVIAPSPTAQRPVRRKRQDNDSWRPFQSP